MAITNAFTDLIKSIGELLSSVFGAAYAIVHSFIMGVFNLFAGFFAFIGDLGKGVFDLAGGVGRFVAGRSTHSFLSPRWDGKKSSTNMNSQAMPSSSLSSAPPATRTCASSSSRSSRGGGPL